MNKIVSVFLLFFLVLQNVTAQNYSFKSSLEYGAEIADFFVSDFDFDGLEFYVNGTKTLKSTVYSAGKYTLKVTSGEDFSAEAEIEISKKKINPGTLIVGSKIYDGTSRVREYSLNFDETQILEKDRFGVVVRLQNTPYFPAKHAGEYNVSAIVSLGGYYWITSNYELETNIVSTTARIYQKETTPYGFSVADKYYDGTDTIISPRCTINIVKGDDIAFKLAEKIIYPSKNVGTYTLTGKFKIEGPDGGNYRLTVDEATTEAKILPLTVSISSFYVADKVYDGTKKVYDYSFISDIDSVKIDGDDLEIGFLSEPEFPLKDVGKYTVTANFTLRGADAQNYVLETSVPETEAQITPMEISISGFSVADKFYDGTKRIPEMNITMPVADGIVDGDEVFTDFSSVPEYPSKEIGENYLIEADFFLVGEDKENYLLLNSALTTYSSIICGENLIHQKFYDVVFISNYEREYSGYQWFKNGEKLEGETKQFFCDKDKFSGFYQCEITKTDGTKILSCPYYPEIKVLKNPEIKVFPNPISSGSPAIIKVENIDLEDAEIMIFNSKGQIVKRILNPTNENEVVLPSGEFSARFVSFGKRMTFKMIVK